MCRVRIVRRWLKSREAMRMGVPQHHRSHLTSEPPGMSESRHGHQQPRRTGRLAPSQTRDVEALRQAILHPLTLNEGHCFGAGTRFHPGSTSRVPAHPWSNLACLRLRWLNSAPSEPPRSPVPPARQGRERVGRGGGAAGGGCIGRRHLAHGHLTKITRGTRARRRTGASSASALRQKTLSTAASSTVASNSSPAS